MHHTWITERQHLCNREDGSSPSFVDFVPDIPVMAAHHLTTRVRLFAKNANFSITVCGIVCHFRAVDMDEEAAHKQAGTEVC